MTSRVSLVMIVRDEAEMASGFIESVRGLWDELIVVDTGSTDDTVARFEAANARVLHHEWHDDFSFARNASLDAVTGDWVLVLDADERVSPEFIHEFLQAIEQPAIGALSVRMSNALPYGHQRESRLLRAWRHDPAIRYRFAIHEDAGASIGLMLSKTGTTLAHLDTPVAHLGYVRERAAAKGKKARDLRLLQQCIATDPLDFYSRMKVLELARYWSDSTLWRSAACETTDVLEVAGRHHLSGYPWGGELVALMAESLFRPDNPAALVYLDSWESLLVPSAPFFHQRAFTHEHLQHLEQAAADYSKCLTLGDALGDTQLTFVRPHLGLARLAIARGAAGDALEHAALALDRAPRDPEALVAVATLTRAMSGMSALEAWAHEHRRQWPSCPEREWAIGEALYALGDYKNAVGWLRLGSGVPPAGPAAIRLAQCLLADGQWAQAEHAARAIARDEPVAALGVMLFDLLQGKDTDLDLDLTPESANAAMKHWVDALLAARNPQWRAMLIQHVFAVRDVFPWLKEYVLRRAS